MQPGRSGTSATNPPPSCSGSGSIITGDSSFAIARFHHSTHEPNQLTYVDRLDWSALRNCQDIMLRRIGHLPVRSAPVWWGASDPVLSAQRLGVVNSPVASWIGRHAMESGNGHLLVSGLESRLGSDAVVKQLGRS